ncbi:MAG: hypothetical protein ACUVV6_00395 [Thermoplasmatota archaeon]
MAARSIQWSLESLDEREWGVILRPGPRPFLQPGAGGSIRFRCARCGLELRAEWIFCPECGSGIGWVRLGQVELQCGVCGEPLEEGWERCPGCTYPIDW